MDINVFHFEDEEFISRRPKVKNFSQEYAVYLRGNSGKNNPYRDPDDFRTCRKIYDMSQEMWGEMLPEIWVTDQLGFSAPSDRRTIYERYLNESKRDDKYEFVSNCIYETRTIGGCFIWPKVYRGSRRVSEYNCVRGGNIRGKFFLEDRADIALLEVQHFFEKFNQYGTKDYSEFIDKYKNDESNKYWMIFNYTSNYPSNQEEYEKMFEWLTKFGTFKFYCEWFAFYDVFVVEDTGVIKVIDIVYSDIQENRYVYLAQPIEYSLFDLPISRIRKMLENVQHLVNRRSIKIHSK